MRKDHVVLSFVEMVVGRFLLKSEVALRIRVIRSGSALSHLDRVITADLTPLVRPDRHRRNQVIINIALCLSLVASLIIGPLPPLKLQLIY